MEKFRTFEDPATGIMPFMPAKIIVPKNILVRMVRGLLGYTAALIRVPLAAFALLWLGACTLLVALIPIPPLRRALKRYCDFVGCRLVLFLLGFWWIPAAWEKKNTVSAKAKAEQGWPPCKDAGAGALLLVNCCSYLDVLYLSFRFSPTFAAVLRDPKAKYKGNVIPMGLFGALYDVVFVPKQDEARSLKISDVIAQAKSRGGGPVCVLPEGVSSCEAVMLPFLPPVGGAQGLETYPWVNGTAPKCYAAVIRYPFKYFSPCYTAGSVIAHVINLASQVYNTMEVVYVSPRVSQIKPKDQGLAPSDRNAASWADGLHTAMCAAASTQKRSVRMVVPRCGVTNESAGEVMSAVEVKRKFMDAYAGRVPRGGKGE